MRPNESRRPRLPALLALLAVFALLAGFGDQLAGALRPVLAEGSTLTQGLPEDARLVAGRRKTTPSPKPKKTPKPTAKGSAAPTATPTPTASPTPTAAPAPPNSPPGASKPIPPEFSSLRDHRNHSFGRYSL